jgi:Ca-activated chloride channel family protein
MTDEIQIQDLNNLLWLLALVPVLLLYLFYEKWKTARKKRMGDGPLVTLMLRGSSTSRNRLKAGLLIAAIGLLAIGLINIQKPVEEAGGGIKGLDVMIALDVSNSMLANDVSPNRLEKARLLASKLIDTLQGNRVGIIAFAGNAYLQLPLTTDITAARLYLQSVSTSLVPNQGTNIQEALQLANESMDQTVRDYKAVVLITDGEELDKNALDAAKELRKAGIVLLTTGVGTAGGATIISATGDVKKDEKGKTVISQLNEKLLQDLARETNGSYRLLGETDVTLQSLLAEIKSMNQKQVSNASLVNYKSYSHYLIAMAFLLLLFDILLAERVEKRKEKPSVNSITNKALRAATILLLVFSIPLASLAQNTQLLLRKANEAYRQKQYATAAKLYSEILKADPNNATAKYNLGNIAYRQKQYEEAVKKYEEAIQAKAEEETKANAFNNKGLSFVEAKDLQKAIDAFKQSLRENPYDGEVRMNLNKALKEKQQQDQQDQKQNDKQDPKQQPKQPPPPPKPKIKKNEAEDKLAALRQEEKKIRDKMNKQPAEPTSDKDW